MLWLIWKIITALKVKTKCLITIGLVNPKKWKRLLSSTVISSVRKSPLLRKLLQNRAMIRVSMLRWVKSEMTPHTLQDSKGCIWWGGSDAKLKTLAICLKAISKVRKNRGAVPSAGNMEISRNLILLAQVALSKWDLTSIKAYVIAAIHQRPPNIMKTWTVDSNTTELIQEMTTKYTILSSRSN